MTCRTWGQYNFETFDGLYYYFPGRCTYTLLRDCEETTQASIVVQVSPDPSVPGRNKSFRLEAAQKFSLRRFQLRKVWAPALKHTLLTDFSLSLRKRFTLKISESYLVIRVNYH